MLAHEDRILTEFARNITKSDPRYCVNLRVNLEFKEVIEVYMLLGTEETNLRPLEVNEPAVLSRRFEVVEGIIERSKNERT
jgi:hypothetical protein